MIVPQGPPQTRRWRRLARALLAAALAALLLLGALWAALRIALAPPAGDWTVTLGRAPFTLAASVPQLAWIATDPSLGPLLDGLRLRSPLGPLTLGWQPATSAGESAALRLHCEPCSVPLSDALGQPRIALPALQLTLARGPQQQLRGALLLGVALPGGDDGVIGARWHARRQGAGWAVNLQWPEAPARHWFALLAPGLPELASARIEGGLALSAELQLPERTLRLTPRTQGLAVSGLGTEAWAHARSSCGPARVQPLNGWLARAVLAAEDQRFFEHPGYDLDELLAALDANQRHGAIRRGGSTLTQQLAKLMVAGDGRSLSRKLRELLYALEIEQTLGKARILQLYLSQAPWGRAADGRPLCGAEAAARHYFGVPPRRLSPRQAVTLAAMLRNPQREAERWAAEGSVDPDRLRWIAQEVRGVPAPQRRALVAALRAEQAAERALLPLAVAALPPP